MLEALSALFSGIPPTLLFAFLLGHLMLAREVSALRSSRRGRLYLGFAFGVMSAVGALFGLRHQSVYVDTAIFVVVAAGLQGGLTCGLASGLLGAGVRFLAPGPMRVFCVITVLGGLAGAGFHRALRGRALRPWEGFLIGAAVGVGQGLLTARMARPWPPFPKLVEVMLPLAALTGLGLMSFLLILRHLQASAEQARLREELAEARVRFLQAQIRPHFLFNALTTLGALVRTEPGRAREVVQSLAEFLRATFRTHGPTVPLSEELAVVRSYVDVERARFGDRLRYAQVIEPVCLPHPVPALLLQPLVENSVRHGFREDGRPLEVGLTARRDGDSLVLTAQDDGIGILPERLAALFGGDSAGIGLRNGRERLLHLYGARLASLTVVSAPGQGTRTEVRLPWNPGEGEEGRKA